MNPHNKKSLDMDQDYGEIKEQNFGRIFEGKERENKK